MFQFAATTFGDANAQYHLARMHLEGAGVDKDGREAIRWLFLAADKGTASGGSARSDAFLGPGRRSTAAGARPHVADLGAEAAIDSKKDKWIIDLYEKAVASANDEDRQDALLYLENHLKRHN